MDNINILQLFNNQFFEFIEDIDTIIPNNKDFLNAKNYFINMRKLNPKLIIKIWKVRVTSKYKIQIEQGDIAFFLKKDYTDDLNNTDSSELLIAKINLIKEIINNMEKENQLKCIKYIQNLTKLSELYN